MPFDPFDDPFRLRSTAPFKGVFPRSGAGRFHKATGASSPDRSFSEIETSGLNDTAEAAEPPKAKVTLRNLKWEVEEVGFNEETDISIDADLPAEYAHKTRVAFELIAKTPDGPERISKADGQIREGKAKAKIPVYIPQYRDENFNLLKTVDYYFTAKHSESDLFKDEKATKTVNRLAERLLEVHVVESITFATDKSFVRASQAAALKGLGQEVADWRGKHPEGKLAVFGHADAVGKEAHNKTLSERRAKAIHGFLAKDPAAWEELYNGEKWGLVTTQELLKHLGHDPGALDGMEGPKTQAAVKDFQGKKGLEATGTADAKTREALYLAFMDDCGSPGAKVKEFDAIDGQPFMGCSEFNLVENTPGASESNRRVAVLLLKSNKNFPVQYPCKQGDIGPCGKQAGRKGERKTPGFKCLFYDQLVVEKKGGGGRQTKASKLSLVGVKDGDTVKQYVNLKSVAKPEEGPERLIEVTIEGAADGTKVFWRATAGRDNSKRNSPKAGLKTDTKSILKEFASGVAELATEVKGGKSSCVLACGVAGGDKYEVEVGLEKEMAESRFSVVTWRRIKYESIQPSANAHAPVTDFTVFTPDRKPGLSSKAKSYLQKVLAEGFVEFEQTFGTNFGIEDLPASGKYNVFDASYIEKEPGKKFCVMTFGQLDAILAAKSQFKSDKLGVSIIWTDYLANMVKWEESFSELSRPDEVESSLAVFEKQVDGMGRNPHGSYSIKRLKWRASHWMDYELGEWKPINSISDPGWKYKYGGILESEGDIKAHVDFVSIRKLAFKFPDSNKDYPGKIIPRDENGRFMDNGVHIALTLTIDGVACTTNLNGAALQGDIWMNTFAGEVHDHGVAGVIAHELGHNMGQAYADASVDAVFGRPASKPIPGVPFPKSIPEGDVYGGRGHQGTHCAKGVKDKSVADFSDSKKSNAFNEHSCIMFGASDMFDSKEFSFCPDCLTYIRAENLEDIRKSWSS